MCTVQIAAELGIAQMLDLPHWNEGLIWITSQGLTQLQLIPGLEGASITAAAEGDQQALTHLRSKA